MKDKEYRREIVLSFLGITLILALLLYCENITGMFGAILKILRPFIVGAAMAYVLNLPMSFIERKILCFLKGRGDKGKRILSILLTLIFVALLIFILLITVIPEIISAVQSISKEIPGFIEKVVEISDKYLSPVLSNIPDLTKSIENNWETFAQNLFPFLKNGLGSILSTTVTAAGQMVSSVASFIVSLIFAIYILGEKERLSRQFNTIKNAYLSPPHQNKLDHFFGVLNKSFSSFITGQCLEAVILGVIVTVVLSILRMPYSVMIGVVVMFSALLPIVGAFIACFIGAFLILLESPIQALVFVVVFLVIQQLENNLIYPKVVGSSVGLPAIWVFIAVTLGGSLFGVVGMLVFIPLVSTFYLLLKEDAEKRIGKRKEKL